MSIKTPLNPQQEQAARHIEGPLLVLAGAGSGKTRIITERVCHLLELGVPADNILALTFTNKAAGEMRHRIQVQTSRHILATTFHSLCARILRESIHYLGFTNDFTIYDEDDTKKLIKECVKQLELKDDKGIVKSFQSQISNSKNELLKPEDISLDEEPDLRAAFHLYQQKLHECNAVDFDDLLYLTVELFREHEEVLFQYQERWLFLLIDEYQDTNKAQYLITKLLVKHSKNIFAVGDPDQSIYSWRGANIQNILNFKEDFPGAEVITLEQNYRSRDNILRAANALIAHNENRFEKKLWSDRSAGDPIGLYICDSDRAEADFIIEKLLHHHRLNDVPMNECVVFYRTNFQSRTIEDALLKYNVPYQIVGGLSFYQRREIKDLLAFLRLITSPSDYISFVRTLNLPKRGIGEKSIERIRIASEEHNLPILSTCEKITEGRITVKLSQKQRSALYEYLQIFAQLRQKVHSGISLHELIGDVARDTGYMNYLKEDKESFEERSANLAELISKAAEWEKETENPTLVKFLEELSLKSSAEEENRSDQCVKLMTLHNGKGLEFQVVFVSGMEEELFPHINSRDTPEQLEEERRLAYVGMTRAKDVLYLTASKFRYLWGTPRLMRPSRFLKEIPKEFLKAYHHHQEEDFISKKTVGFDDDVVADEEPGIREGDRVKHQDFGVGIVREIRDSSIGPTFKVFFDEDGSERVLVAKFARLIKVSF